MYHWISLVAFIFCYFKGTRIIPTPDQDQTDFTKCLQILIEQIAIKKIQVGITVNKLLTQKQAILIILN